VPNIVGYDYKIEFPDSWQALPKSARRFEMLGQRDDVNIISLIWTQAMWEILSENAYSDSAKDPYTRVTFLSDYLKSKLKDPWEILTPQSSDRSLGVVQIKAPRNNRSQSLYDFIYDQFRISGAGGGADPEQETFRLCPHVYNTMADIDLAVTAMNTWRETDSSEGGHRPNYFGVC